VAVREWGDRVVFLHRIESGGTDRSYGIHVARLAGLPPEVVARAGDVLAGFEDAPARRVAPIAAENTCMLTDGAARVAEPRRTESPRQLSLFAEPEHPILAELRRLDPDRTTPIDALARMSEWRSRLGSEPGTA
jgi:DNA mismatch repair protein MutS